MKYRELQEELQGYMNRKGWIKGYCREQERMAEKPCHDAITNSAVSGILSIKRSSGADIFFDIFASVAGQNVRIGVFRSNGTIHRQAVKAHLFYIEDYGEEDIRTALLHIVRDQFEERAAVKEEELKIKKEEVLRLEKEQADILSVLQEIYRQQSAMA